MASDIQAIAIKSVQGIGYLSAFILSLVICVPMSMNQDQFKGRCLLFSTGIWQEKDGQFVVNWASQAYCNFTIFVAVIMFVISVIQLARFIKFLKRGKDSSFFSAFVDVVICILMCIFVLIAGSFVSAGFNTWCSEMTRRFPTCTEATGSTIDKSDGIDSSGFYFQMSVAQFGIWASLSIWVILLTFSTVKLCRFHHEENLRVSMAKERKRLLNEDLVSEVPVHTSFSGNESRHQKHRHQRREVEEKEATFEEVVHVTSSNEAANHGLVNESDEIVQQGAPSSVAQDMNVSMEDGSLSSMASSRHSYDTRSLPKGNQITIDRPDLLK